MEKERNLQALDDSELDAVNGGVAFFSEVQGSPDELRLNVFGQGNDSGPTVQKSTLEKVVQLIWNR